MGWLNRKNGNTKQPSGQLTEENVAASDNTRGDKQVESFVHAIVKNNGDSSIAPVESVRSIIDRAVIDAEQIAASIKMKARREAEAEAVRIIDKAKQGADEILEKNSLSAQKAAEELLLSIDATNGDREELKRKTIVFLAKARGEIEKEIRDEYKQAHSRLLYYLLGSTGENLYELGKPLPRAENALRHSSPEPLFASPVEDSKEPRDVTLPETSAQTAENVRPESPSTAIKEEPSQPPATAPVAGQLQEDGSGEETPAEKQAGKLEETDVARNRKAARQSSKEARAEAKRLKKQQTAPSKAPGNKNFWSLDVSTLFPMFSRKNRKPDTAEPVDEPDASVDEIEESSDSSAEESILSLYDEVEKTVSDEMKATPEPVVKAESSETFAPQNAAAPEPEEEIKAGSLKQSDSNSQKHSPVNETPSVSAPLQSNPTAINPLTNTKALYSGEIDLVIKMPVTPSAISRFYNHLQLTSEMKVLYTRGSWDKGTTITISLDKPLPLIGKITNINELEVIPEIAQTVPEHKGGANTLLGANRKVSSRLNLTLREL